MAKIPDTIAQNIDRFLNVVRQRQRIEAAYLYGSYSKGTATAWSDVDLAIVSPDFSGDLFEEQLRLLHLAAQIDDRIEARPFRPEGFTINEPLVYEILKTGVQIA